jgi:hypothetical protein
LRGCETANHHAGQRAGPGGGETECLLGEANPDRDCAGQAGGSKPALRIGFPNRGCQTNQRSETREVVPAVMPRHGVGKIIVNARRCSEDENSRGRRRQIFDSPTDDENGGEREEVKNRTSPQRR